MSVEEVRCLSEEDILKLGNALVISFFCDENSDERICSVFKMDLSSYEEDDVERLLHEQATILFKRCDYGNKNYVTREDLLTLASELDLSTDQVTEAFDKLNINNRDYLTLREFINGFGVFLGLENEQMDLRNGGVDGVDEVILENAELEKAAELFNACDINNRGYVSLYDLKQLTNKLDLSETQISDIFRQLDDDDNGFITLNEFVNGFSHFMDATSENNNHAKESPRLLKEKSMDEIYFTDSTTHAPVSGKPRLQSSGIPHDYLERSDSQTSRGSRGSERSFITRQMSIRYETGSTEIDDMLDSIENEFGSAVSKDQLQDIWNTVSFSGDPNTTKVFESFLGKVYNELRTARQETKHLENVLERKSQVHQEEMKKIYDEVEIQMQTEKLKQTQQLAEKETVLREDMLRELKEKEGQIEKMIQRENTLANRLSNVKEQEQSLKHQNSKLMKENMQLEDQLNDSMSNLSYLKTNLQHMEEQTTAEKKETLKAAVQATQGIQSEHESLIKQLDLLRSMNQKLRDERDSLELSIRSKTSRLDDIDGIEDSIPAKKPISRHGSNIGKYIQERSSSTPTHSPLSKQGSIMSNYFEPLGDHRHSSFSENLDAQLSRIGEGEVDTSVFDSVIEMDEPSSNEALIIDTHQQSVNNEPDLGSQTSSSPAPSSPRQEPVGMNNDEEHFSDNISSVSHSTAPVETPSRVYKCVFVGDSGVGKSSFIHRFCFDEFQKNFSATIGVDMHVKTIKVKRQWVALQLWDTAGQERFRSITKNYFRRADGVIVMFDVTSETSFLNVKGWMLNIEEGAEPDCQIMLLGNKKDLCDNHPKKRKITPEMAQTLADSFGATYYEVSALSGTGVLESIDHLATRMALNEDGLMQKSVIDIHKYCNAEGANGEKKKCCR
ncbi:EF-hand calcium-binding domain-containing protein 4B-like isoform X2 [Clytia hemisphaerica]|uniref:EF-hand calcium-binding domain-containing protein 4B-like isoform X2 n=1 Tax=Clytia hemisphaerica TaxID=252671 RepID=UPI0034D5BC47